MHMMKCIGSGAYIQSSDIITFFRRKTYENLLLYSKIDYHLPSNSWCPIHLYTRNSTQLFHLRLLTRFVERAIGGDFLCSICLRY